MKIFGIGMPRTGTHSLCAALTMLGYKAVHNPGDKRTVDELKTGAAKLSILEYVDAIADLPAAIYFEKWYEAYPNSLFIHTSRDTTGIREWLESCRKWWEFIGCTSAYGIAEIDKETHGKISFLHGAMFGCVAFDEELFRQAYIRHSNAIDEFFSGSKRRQLLYEFDLDDCDDYKWGRLCEFVRKPVPPLGTPFPRSYSLAQAQLRPTNYQYKVLKESCDFHC